MEVTLKTFVQETINEIIEGVVQSQKDMLAKYDQEKDPNISISSGGFNRIEFDVFVTSTKEAEAGGKAGISIKVLDIAGNAKESTENRAENRIKFSVLYSVSEVNNYPTYSR